MEHKTTPKELNELMLLEIETREYSQRLAILRSLIDEYTKEVSDVLRDEVFDTENNLDKTTK